MERVPILRRLLSATTRRRADMGETAADHQWDREAENERHRGLLEALDRAESLNDAKSRFLAVASHEIRTPLNGMLGIAAVLQETELTPEQANFVQAIRASGGLLLGLVDDMLDLARIEAGHLEIEPAPASPADLVQEVVELLAVRAFTRGIDLAAYAAPQVPASVSIDGPRLRQVLINLIGNAIKYTERGGISVEVDCIPSGPSSRLSFAVADTGSGMDAPAARTRLGAEGMPPVQPANRPQHGAGLGLPIACEIVRRMGGEVDFAERPAGGTSISFWIPVDAAADPQPLPPPRHNGLVLSPEGFGADIAIRILAEDGVETRCVDTLARATALLAAASAANSTYDLILIDARVAPAPAETLAALREAAGERVPAAIMIEPGNRKSVPMLHAAGYDAYLVRPIRRASLVRIVEGLIAGATFRLDPADEKRPGRLAASAARRLSSLVVDDNEINALLLRVVLERLGHRVTERHDGLAALAAAEAQNFDAVFLDFNLPGMGGADVAANIRRRAAGLGKRPHLIAVTGDAIGVREKGAEFDAFLEKPVTPEALRALLERLNAPTAA
jgi:signal transduction histidine kinase/CheY-like chemotaxis protein